MRAYIGKNLVVGFPYKFLYYTFYCATFRVQISLSANKGIILDRSERDM